MKRKPQNKYLAKREPAFEETVFGKVVLTVGALVAFWCVAVLFGAF